MASMKPLSPDDIAYFKGALSRQLDDLLAAAGKTVKTLIRSGEWAADPLDQAVMEIDRNYTLRIRDRESHFIKKIKIALEKIEDGSFGICEGCDDEISLARLKARPVTAYCIQCKTHLEAAEKSGICAAPKDGPWMMQAAHSINRDKEMEKE